MKKQLTTLLLATVLAVTSLPAIGLAAESGVFPYEDVSSQRWSYEGISYAWDNGLIEGSSDNEFSPAAGLTKGDLAQALYVMGGSPSEFTAAEWCENAGIFENGFAADAALTREDAVSALYQYAGNKGYDVSNTTGMVYYTDNGDVSEDAAAAIKWALASGIISGVSPEELAPKATVTREQAAVMLYQFALTYDSDVDVSIKIIATSDMHGWFVPWDFSTDIESTSGSVTYLSTIIKSYREDNENVIYVDCGDTVQSNYVEYFIDSETNPMIEALNYLDCDVWTFGNHEYNFTYEQRQNLIKQFDGAALSGNVYMKGTDEAYLPATAVVERDGVKIGFIGLTTPMIEFFEKGRGTIDEVDVYNPMDIIPAAIDELQKQDVDCIVGVIHQGLTQENSIYGTGNTDIARVFPEFDVIVSGHLHALVESETANGVLLCEPYYYGRALSAISLDFTKTEDGYSLINKNAKIEKCGSVEEEGMVELMTPYKEELSGFVNTPIGELINSDLKSVDEITGISSNYTEASAITHLFGTASIYYTGADCIFLGCAEDAGFTTGNVSIKDISSSYSYATGEITIYPVTGEQLTKILEFSSGYLNQIKEGDLTISCEPSRRTSRYSTYMFGTGMYYEVDLREPEGSRIKNLALITKDESGNPLYNEDGSFVTTPITDTTIINFGTNSYSFDQWTSKGGCLEGEDIASIYCSTGELGDEGSIRAMTISYIRDHLNGVIDGDVFQYDNWKLLTGIDKESAEYKKAVELVNDGTLTVPASEAGHTNIAPITVEDVKPYL